MKERITYIKDFKKGMHVRGFYLCKKIDNKITRLGDDFLDLLLEDKTGIIKGKIWNNIDEYKFSILQGKPVAVKGLIIEYNKTNEINISFINNADMNLYGKYGFKEENLIIKVDYNIEKLVSYLLKEINDLGNSNNKEVKKLIKDNINKIKTIPSLNKRYKLYGGYLLEIVELLKLNKKLFKIYPNKNEIVVIHGIILKNIGLIDYFNDDLQFSTSPKGKKIDLKLLSIQLISKYFKESNEIKIILQNSILNNEKNLDDKNVNYINALYKFNNNVNN